MFVCPSVRPSVSLVSGDPGSDGGVWEESEAGSEVSAEEGWVGGGRPATAGGTTMILIL